MTISATRAVLLQAPELTNPQNVPEPDGATLTIESNSDLGTLYSYSKTTAFTGTDEENAAEIMANGVGQSPVVGTNTRVVTGQDGMTDYYAGWVQDSEGYGADLAMEFHIAADAERLTIPGGAGTYLFDIDWGDGTPVETGLTTQGAGPHTYTLAGDYVVRISGVFPHVYFNNGGDILKLTKILNWGDVGWTSCNTSFRNAENLTEITIGVTDTSAVTSMFSMLRGLPSLQVAPDLSSFDTRRTTTVQAALLGWTAAGAVDIGIDKWQIPMVANFLSFMLNSQLTTDCYDRTLNAWSVQDLVNTTNVDFGNSTYSDVAAHAAMVANVGRDSNGLLVIDGGLAP